MGAGLALNVAMLVAAGIIYGAIFPINRLAAEAGWPPVSFALLQSVLAFVVLGSVVVLRGGRLVPSVKHAVSYVVIGALVIGLPIGLLTKAALYVPASVLTLILALSPVFTLVFATMLGLETFRLRTVVAVLLGLCGVAMIAWPGASSGATGSSGWFLVALLAAVMFAAANVSASVLRPPATESLTMAAGILGGAALTAAPVALLVDRALLPGAPSGQAWLALAVATGINAVFYVLFFEIVRRAGPTFFSTFNYLAIVAGIAWSQLIFKETLPPVFWVALLLMLASVFTAVGRSSGPDKEPKPA